MMRPGCASQADGGNAATSAASVRAQYCRGSLSNGRSIFTPDRLFSDFDLWPVDHFLQTAAIILGHFFPLRRRLAHFGFETGSGFLPVFADHPFTGFVITGCLHGQRQTKCPEGHNNMSHRNCPKCLECSLFDMQAACPSIR
jgi:hypothetical protein